VRWLAQGVATKQEITDMIALAHGLSTTQARRVRLHCRFSNRGTEHVSESGVKRMDDGTKRE
jgi:hypothetical protein